MNYKEMLKAYKNGILSWKDITGTDCIIQNMSSQDIQKSIQYIFKEKYLSQNKALYLKIFNIEIRSRVFTNPNIKVIETECDNSYIITSDKYDKSKSI